MEALIASAPIEQGCPATYCAATSKSVTLFSVESQTPTTTAASSTPHRSGKGGSARSPDLQPSLAPSGGAVDCDTSSSAAAAAASHDAWPQRCAVIGSGSLSRKFTAASPAPSQPATNLLSCLALNHKCHAVIANTMGSVAVAAPTAHRKGIACADLFLPYLPDASYVSTAAWSPLCSSLVLLGSSNGRMALVDTDVQYCPGHGASAAASSQSQALSEWNFSGRITAVQYVPHTNTAVVSYAQANAGRYGLLLCDPRLSDSGTAVTFGSDELNGGDDGNEGDCIVGVDDPRLGYRGAAGGGPPADPTPLSASSSTGSSKTRKKKKRAAVTSFFLGLCPLPYAEVLSCHLNQCSVATAGGSGNGVEILQLWDVRHARQPVHQVRSRRDEFQHIAFKPNPSSLALLTMMKNGSMKIFDFSSIAGCSTDAAATAAPAAAAGLQHLPPEIYDLMDTSTVSSGVTSIIASHLSLGACLQVHVRPPKLQSVAWLAEPSDAILAVDCVGAVRVVPARLGVTVTWGLNRQPLVALGHTVAETFGGGASPAAAAHQQQQAPHHQPVKQHFLIPRTAIAAGPPESAFASCTSPLSLASFPQPDIEEIMLQRLHAGFSADLTDALAAAVRTKEASLATLLRYLRLMIGKYSGLFHCSRTSGLLQILRLPGAMDETTGEVAQPVRELILTAVGWPLVGAYLDMADTSRDHVEKTAAIRIFTNCWDDAAQWLSLNHRVNPAYGVLAPLLQCAMAIERQQKQAASRAAAAAASAATTTAPTPTSHVFPSVLITPELADQLKTGMGKWLQPAITYILRSASEESIVANATISFCDKIGLAAAILPRHADLVAALETLAAEKECSFERCLLLGFGEDGLTEMQRYIDVTGDFQLGACVFAPFIAKNYQFVTTWSEEYRKFVAAKGLFFHRARYDLAVRKHMLSVSHVHHDRHRPHCEVRCACGHPMHEKVAAGAMATSGGLRPVQAGLCRSLDCKPMCVVCARRVEGPAVETHPAMWYAWCTTCLHGGHLQHLKQWFAKHKQCPVEVCSCECCEHSSSV